MKGDLGSNYTVSQGKAPVSVGVGTCHGVSVDHGIYGPCAAFYINCGAVAAGGRLTAKLQYSDDDSTYSDDDGTSGNTYTVTRTTSGLSALYAPNPMGRYSRAYITVATDAVVVGVVNVIGPKRTA
jgi:hypothetical protein